MRLLIAGANRGLGLEFAKQYAADGATVVATARDPKKAEALNALAAANKGVTVRPLETTDPASVAALAKDLAGAPLDLVIANAGVYGGDRQGTEGMDYDAWARTLAVNTMAPLRLAEALRPNLAKGANPKFVAITSRMGSIGEASAGYVAYRSSKAALNMVMRLLAADWKSDGVAVLALHPGWVQTDMGGPNAPLKPADAIAAMRKTIAGLTPEKSGLFLNYDGATLPW